jgi:hypothetical protein
MRRVIALLVLALGTFACQASPQSGDGPEGLPEPRARDEAGRCASHEPLRQAFFGDLHVHTSWSMDAFVFESEATPDDAYRFAQGATLELQGGRIARLERALDFAAVSEHAEFIGETALCIDEHSEIYDHPRCKAFRGEGDGPGHARMGALTDSKGPFVETESYGQFGWRVRAPELCGPDLSLCLGALGSVWSELQKSAARWNDTSEACRFTTFNGYEWSWSPQLSKVHRNVIFRNAAVPALPLTAIEYDEPVKLWQGLQRECIESGTGCDVLTIPHNPNYADGRLLHVEYEAASLEEARAIASLRASLEPLVEIMQVKGDSECANGFSNVVGGRDELCEFEKIRGPDLPLCDESNRFGSIGGLGCTTPTNYVRYALVEGLRQAERLGVNPLKLGITASTDVHDGNPGDTEEYSFQGFNGIHGSATARERLEARSLRANPLAPNPGGLMGVWAEENSRDALFDAMERRETFGTSGVRIRPRFYGAWEMDDALCGWPDHVKRADAQAVPMGADLPTRAKDSDAPIFMASALRDVGTELFPGNPLERIQIIKGWLGPDGSYQQAVHDVVVTERRAELDVRTCEVDAAGGDHGLCAVWQDPDFDPTKRAFYYARVVEVPSCRWNAWDCSRLPEAGRPAACSDPAVPTTIQERAWTSPIWYTPS